MRLSPSATRLQAALTPGSGGSSPLHAAGCDVAIDLALVADEDDAVAGRIAAVPFHLLVRHIDPRAARQDAFAVGDDGYIVIAFDLEIIGLERIGLAAA